MQNMNDSLKKFNLLCLKGAAHFLFLADLKSDEQNIIYPLLIVCAGFEPTTIEGKHL